jgi:hypothetical protein
MRFLSAGMIRRSPVWFVFVMSLVLTLFGAASSAVAQGSIQFIQGSYAVPQTPQATVTVTYPGGQSAGNLNVVMVGWNDSTATVTGVTDSRGNAYALAVGPTVMAGKASHAIYYANNIVPAVGGTNTITVRFNVAAVYPDVRILEYSGLDTSNPLVGGVGSSGTSGTANSGSLTTTTPNVLLVAGNVVQTTTSGAGAGFTSRMITNPDGDIAEDRIVATVGTYSATAPLSTGYWVMQMAAFRATGSSSSDTIPPTVAVTAPAASTTVSGTVTVTATASDNVAVAGVQFKLDGTNLGAEVTGASPYSISWNTTGVANGSHSLTAVARDTANLLTTSVAVPVSVSNSDPIPPTVAITAPAAGATVSGTVTVAATASDNVAVAGMQFRVDGVNIGSEVTAAPYSISWNTTAIADGPHALTAVARDTASPSNTTISSPVAITVANTSATDPSRIGQWSAPLSWPMVGVHLTLMPNGQILVWDGAAQNGVARVWNPSTNGFTKTTAKDNLFCAGHTLLPDGRVFVAGGHIANYVGLPDANLFQPSNRRWSSAAPMQVGRWYPTVTVLPDGRALVVSGAIDCEACIALIPEIYNPGTNTWSTLPNASLELPLFPHMFVLPDGRVLATGAFEGPSPAVALDLNTGTWSTIDPTIVDGHSSAMYALGKIVKSGTSANSDPPYGPAEATTYVLDMTQAAPRWRQTSPMANPRSYHTLTLLPDGNVLATGGGMSTDTFDETQAVLAGELWSPVTETWTSLASMTVPRLYHSTALLLPDGRVVVAGGGRFGNPTGDYHDKLNAEIYSPPYLFKGTRPVITAAPSLAPYGFTMSIATPDAARIASVALVPLGSVTHHFNQTQRFLRLPFQQTGNGLNVQAPIRANDAPPGYYMLFIVDTSGVPSIARIIQIQ